MRGGAHNKLLKQYSEMKKLHDYPFRDDKLKSILAKYIRLNLKAFFLVGLPVMYKQLKMREDIYELLCNLYTFKNDASLFDFKGVIIPKPTTDMDKIDFIHEFLNLMLYHLIDDMSFTEMFNCDYPYEIGDIRVDKGDIVIDAGANIGMFSALASRKCCDREQSETTKKPHLRGKVYAFEPLDYVIENYLSKTAKWNPNISVCKYALSDKIGKVNFTQIDYKHTSSRITNKEMEQIWNTSGIDFAVQTTTLDAFVKENNIPRVDFIKADIEGAERLMLKGAEKIMKDYAPKLAICTYHLPDDPKVIRELISEANPDYVIKEVTGKIYAYIPKKLL